MLQLKERFNALLLIAGVEFLSSLVLPFAPRNDLYFIACAAFNSFTLLVFVKFFKRTNLIKDLALLTIIQFSIQGLGWILYGLYITPIYYNWSIHLVVLVTFLRIIIVGSSDDDFTCPARRRIFLLPFNLGRERISGVPK